MAETSIVPATAGERMAVKVKKRVPRRSPKKVHPPPRLWRDVSIQEQMLHELIQAQLPLFTAKRWMILPSLHWGVERYIFLMNPRFISEVLGQIKRDAARIKTFPPAPALFATPYDITEGMLRQAKNMAIVNNKVRNRFQVLARRWKMRNLKRANMEDLLTGEEPVQCIRLIDFKNRSEYVFEADTIHKDMYERLLQHYYTFPEPAAPRNPYTNELMTFPQFFNVMTQLHRVPGKKIHWALDALLSCSYDMTTFHNRMISRLRQALIQRIMSTPTHDTGMEVLADFIEDCFEETTLITSENMIKYRIRLYRWAARNLATHPQLCRWRAACYKHQLQRINAIPPTLEQKDELNREIAKLIVQTPHPDVHDPFDKLVAIATAPLPGDTDSDAWDEDFGLNNILIITSDTSLFEATG